MGVKKLGVTKNGIETYELTNGNLRLEVLNYGARLHKLFVPSNRGEIDVLLGFDDPDGYLGDNPYFNAVIGRVANRIRDSKFTLDGKTYTLYPNFGAHCLHGGENGFDRRFFTVTVPDENKACVKMTYVSPDGEEHFPATLTLTVTYTLTDNDELQIRYDAESDGSTPFNPTNHAYFNFNGDYSPVLDTVVFIDSEQMTESDEGFTCTGKILDIKGTPFDFSKGKAIGDKLDKENVIFKNALGGYDFNYILRPDRDVSKPAAQALNKKTGIRMDVYTDRPCLQLYSGNFLDGTVVGKAAFPYQSAFCMETQGYPNACNIPSFPQTTLHKGEKFRSQTTYAFRVVR